MGLRTAESPKAFTPLIPSPQDLLGLEAAAIPAEPKISSTSLPRVPGRPSSQERPQLGSDTETPTWETGVEVPSLEEGNLARQQIQEAQA